MFEQHCVVIEKALARAEELEGMQQLSERFFEIFFEQYPQTLQYFEGTDIPQFAPRKFQIIITFFIDVMKHPDFADGELTDEVRRHIVYGLSDKEYYIALIDAIELVIREALGDEWTDELAEYWNDAALGMKGIVADAATHVFKVSDF